MKRFFSFIFNVLRNFSLLVVISLVLFIVFIALNEDATKQFIASIDQQQLQRTESFEPYDQKYTDYQEKEEDHPLQHLLIDEEDDELIESMAMDEVSVESFRAKKYKIPIKGGSAFLRPTQIMYVNSGTPLQLVKNDETIIEPKIKLYQMEKLLTDNIDACFFAIKTAIINCNYIEQLVRDSNKIKDKYIYQDIVIMEDGEQIPISKDKAKELLQILEDQSY